MKQNSKFSKGLTTKFRSSISWISFLFFLSLSIQSSMAQTLSVTLNASNIGCNSYRTGSINATVSGGVPPYHFRWSNDAPDAPFIYNLSIGYYECTVTDATGAEARDEITIIEPEPIRITQFSPTVYANGYNTSCFFCFDGAITLSVAGGVAPYTYVWSDGSTQQNRTGLAPKAYQVKVTDAYGCVFEDRLSVTLVAPERDDWTANGNSNVGANSFIGTTTNYDFVLKANNTEGLRVKTNGDAIMNYNLGIGTNTPTEKLEVSGGNARFGNKIIIGNGSTGISYSSSTQLLNGNTINSNNLYFGDDGFTNPNSGHPPALPNVCNFYSASTNQVFQTNNFLNNIQIHNSIDANNSNNTETRLMMQTSTNNASIDAINVSIPSNKIPLEINKYCNGDILMHGKVGINLNNSNPQYALDIGGDVNITGNFKINGTNIQSVIQPISIMGAWETGNSTVNPQDICYTDGQVGVKTCNPLASLHVNSFRSILLDNIGGVNPSLYGEYIGFNAKLANSSQNFEKLASGNANNGDQRGGATIATNYNGDLEIQTFDAGIGFENLSKTTNYNPKFIFKTNGSLNLKENLQLTNLNDGTEMLINAIGDAGRLISNHSVSIFLDYNNSHSNEFFSINKNSSYFGGNMSTLLSVQETGRTSIFYNGPGSANDKIFAVYSSGNEFFRVSGAGKTFAASLRVTSNSFPDYIFDDCYELKTLDELEKYVNNEKHLPGMPTEAEVVSEGLDVNQVIVKNTENIEQLHLYLFEMNKRLNKLEEENKQLKIELLNAKK